jgi:hypothetical protein
MPVCLNVFFFYFLSVFCLFVCVSTLIKKKINFFPIYKEIQSGAVAQSYMRKGFPIYEEMRNISPYIRRPLVIYDFATAPF